MYLRGRISVHGAMVLMVQYKIKKGVCGGGGGGGGLTTIVPKSSVRQICTLPLSQKSQAIYLVKVRVSRKQWTTFLWLSCTGINLSV